MSASRPRSRGARVHPRLTKAFSLGCGRVRPLAWCSRPRSPTALLEGALMPDWVDPVAHYMIHEGLKNTAKIAVFSVAASTALGIVLGTLMTIRFLPLQALIRLY